MKRNPVTYNAFRETPVCKKFEERNKRRLPYKETLLNCGLVVLILTDSAQRGFSCISESKIGLIHMRYLTIVKNFKPRAPTQWNLYAQLFLMMILQRFEDFQKVIYRSQNPPVLWSHSQIWTQLVKLFAKLCNIKEQHTNVLPMTDRRRFLWVPKQVCY